MVETTLMRVRTSTRDKLKSLAGDSTMTKYLEAVLDAVAAGGETNLESVRGTFTFADIHQAVTALNTSVDKRLTSIDSRMSGLEKVIEEQKAILQNLHEGIVSIIEALPDNAYQAYKQERINLRNVIEADEKEKASFLKDYPEEYRQFEEISARYSEKMEKGEHLPIITPGFRTWLKRGKPDFSCQGDETEKNDEGTIPFA